MHRQMQAGWKRARYSAVTFCILNGDIPCEQKGMRGHLKPVRKQRLLSTETRGRMTLPAVSLFVSAFATSTMLPARSDTSRCASMHCMNIHLFSASSFSGHAHPQFHTIRSAHLHGVCDTECLHGQVKDWCSSKDWCSFMALRAYGLEHHLSASRRTLPGGCGNFSCPLPFRRRTVRCMRSWVM